MIDKKHGVYRRYPDYVYAKYREIHNLILMEEKKLVMEVNDANPSRLFQEFMEYEGIIGFDRKILGWVSDLFNVKLQR